MSEQTAARNAAMVRQYHRGDTTAAIGRRHGLTKERARQIVRRRCGKPESLHRLACRLGVGPATAAVVMKYAGVPRHRRNRLLPADVKAIEQALADLPAGWWKKRRRAPDPREAKALARLMARHRLNQSELARRVGIKQPGISELLAAKVGMSRARATRLAAFFGVPLKVLFREKPQRTVTP